MKDLEKIKSEDLGCQVQDANPGNFGIEQEVAQLVGATVPAPTAPSADDARELGAQLLVFLRRALTPIQSALRTALAAIYAHLDSRCTDYTPAAYASFQDPSTVPPYDPMRPLIPRTLPNLLTAITAFSARKISNGSATADGIPDGVSLAHLLSETDTANAVAELKDDNAYVSNKAINCHEPVFPNLQKITLGATENTAYVFYMYGYNAEMNTLKEIHFPNLVIGRTLIQNAGVSGWFHPGFANLETITFPKLREIQRASYAPSYAYGFISRTMPSVTKLEFPELVTLNDCFFGGQAFTGLTELRMPKLKYANYAFFNTHQTGDGCPNLQLFEVGPVETNLNISFWNPTDKGTTFLQNFKDHIALRLTANGSGKTLTLSKEVRNAIHAAEATYGIEAIIVTQKGWRIQPDAS